MKNTQANTQIENTNVIATEYANTLYEIVYYCLEPPPSLNSRWL